MFFWVNPPLPIRPLLQSLLRVLVALVFLWGGLPAFAWALPSAVQIQERLEQIEADSSLSDSAKSSLQMQLKDIQEFLDDAQKYKQAEQQFSAAARNAPEQTRQLTQEIKRLERTSAQWDFSKLEKAGVDVIESELLNTVSTQNSLLSEVNQTESQMTKIQNRPQAILEILRSLSTRHDRLETALDGEHPLDGSDQKQVIKHWLYEAEKFALDNRKRSLEQELLSHQVRMELLKTKATFLELQLRNANLKVEQVQELVSSQRVESAEKAQKSITRQEHQLRNQHKTVQRLAALNTSLSESISDTTKHLKQVESAAADVTRKTFDLGERFRSTQQKIEIAGLSQALGQILLEEKRSLPKSRNLPNSTLTNRDIIAEAGLRQIQHEEERRRLRSIDDYVAELSQGLVQDIARSIYPDLLDLSEQRRELLDKAIEVEQSYVRSLGELEVALRQYRKKAETYNIFLTERLLWIRSSTPVNLAMLQNTFSQLLEILAPEFVTRLGKDIVVFAKLKILTWVIVLALLGIVFKTTFFHRELLRLCEPLQRLSTDSYIYTLKTLLLTLLYAASWPLILYAVGSGLNSTPGIGIVSQAVASTLTASATFFFFINSLRKLTVHNGLAAAHFKWPKDSVNIIHRDFGRYQRWFMPMLVLSFFTSSYDFSSSNGALPHLTIALTMLVFAYCSLRLVRNRKGMLNIYENRATKPPPLILRRCLILLVVLVPLVLVITVLAGYVYTTSTLCLHLLQSIMLVVGLYVVHQLVVRWLVLTQRKIAYRNAIEKRQQAKLKKVSEQEQGANPDGIGEVVEEPTINLEALSKGSRELLNTFLVIVGAVCIWLIWNELLPAFGILDDVSVWQYTDLVGSEEQQIPVTLFDLGLALLIVTLTFLAAKRIPALLEFIFLDRVKFAEGGLYAMRTLSGYVIVATGVLMALSTLGASWSQIQWLAAALSVGIGFGLQEIVANFISGLIILFERPIRVGDVVTVGDTDGVVTKIKIRATTIRNWDQKELLVPNKEFITNRLLNWTLSDQTTRLLIPVGIAYGADAHLAMQLIEKAARDNTNVIDDPAPSVSFESFGDNALVIYLRAFIASLDVRLITTTELHLDIYENLNAAGISIAFPQRDVHLDTSRPLEVRMMNSEQE